MSCCNCASRPKNAPSLPVVYLVPQQSDGGGGAGHHSNSGKAKGGGAASAGPKPQSSGSDNDIKILDEDYIRKHFDLPQRALYLDPFRRPLITFPMTQEGASKNFNMAKKSKINQQILDGVLDPSEAVMAESVFPFPPTKGDTAAKAAAQDEETIYILQLPDWEFQCPIHNQPVRTPRFIWHSCKKSTGKGADGGKADGKKPCPEIAMKPGGGPLNKPKPWLLSRLTDFDTMSQW